MGATFDNFLTKDDTSHVAGYVGEGNPNALVNRQLLEPTPHRQAHQLAPVMYTVSGTNEHVLTQQGFLQQLRLMGVDTANVDQWANTETFNWIPPVNLDMFINYADYFWKPAVGQTPPQHFTIENRCNKVTSKLRAYQTILARRGKTMDVVEIDFENNAFKVQGKQDDLYVADFVFNTKGNTNVNVSDKKWTSTSSIFNSETDLTTIYVTPQIALVTPVDDITAEVTPPSAEFVGQWWYKYSTNPDTPLRQLYTWTGSDWAVTSQSIPFYISLVEQESIYQAEVNCACQSDNGGWDVKQWDDGQKTDIVWNTDLLANISFNTEQEWIDNNTQTSPHDLWYDLSDDTLKQRNGDNTEWVVVQTKFSEVIIETTGTGRWDASAGCTTQVHNQWTKQNEWVHKSELTTFVGAKRAQVPILEYSSQIEMNEWTETTYTWKYRSEQIKTFESTNAQPNRLELEPIKSYVVNNIDGVWYIYLAAEKSSMVRDIDLTGVFVPEYKFRIVDKYGMSELFTVERSEYREVGDEDPANLPKGTFVTIVQIKETDFPAPLIAGVEYEKNISDPQPPYTRIEPIVTSNGDSWKGYHIHWLLDTTVKKRVAAPAQMVNPYIKHSETIPSETLTLTEGTVYVTDVHQEFIPALSGITQVNLDYRFHYKTLRPSNYAVTGEENLRVYLNGVRQYGTYEEVSYTTPATPDYTIVDGIGLDDSVTAASFKYVYAVRFEKPLTVNDVVRIEVCPASYHDLGLGCVPVRTVEDDAEFTRLVQAGIQPAFKSLIKYHRNEQSKTKINQYPLFNVYDIITGEIVNTSPLFAFVEDDQQPVNSSTQRRIVVDSSGKEFLFEQFLVDEDNGKMYAYRKITGDEPDYWYSPLTQQLKKWDGATWTDSIMSNSTTGMVSYKPVVSVEEPTSLRQRHMSIWVNPLTLGFYQRDAINGVWNTIGGVEISDADPTFQTVWKTSKTQTEYVPKYVNGQREEVEKGSASGDWEVLSQWRNNPEHMNHKQVLYSQLITHLTTIVAQQDRIPGLTNNGIFTILQQDYNYGAGGTIKEHNDAFDTLISAVNVTEVTPVGVIEFAQQQYASNMVVVRDAFTSNIVDALIEYSGYNFDSIKTKLTELCITSFANNDFVAKVYGDTSAYDETTKRGMPNWIATAPMFGLADKVKPHVVKTSKYAILTHHDGHKSYISFTAAEQDRLSRVLARAFNAAVPGSVVISSTQPTTQILPVYWYEVGAGKHNLYKLKSSIDREWELIDFTDMLSAVYLDIEQRLYDMVPLFPVPVFDYSELTSTEANSVVYNERLRTRFMQYVSSKQIKAPLINTQYTLTDPYTWNYIQCVIDQPPRADITPSARAYWQALYHAWYGTSTPNLEPWALQGYTEKPLWWDNEYLDQTGTRRWKYNHASKTGMWENIRLGIIPAGYQYPNSIVYSTGNPEADGVTLPTYNYFSVNISDEVIAGGYGPDDMLPPYYDNTLVAPFHPTVRSLFRVFSTQIIAPSADYMFGEFGPAEWEWRSSAEYVYDNMVVAFLMQPSKFLHQAFGLKYVSVSGLQFDVESRKVYNHREALFHGDIYDTNKHYRATGLNQWYVNFNRFNGFDTNVEFRTMWTGWTPRQSYQCAGIIDTSTLQVFNKNFDVTDRDFAVVLANSGVVNEMWTDAFNVSIMTIPPAIRQFNNQAKWKFSIDTATPIAKNIRYYGTKSWPFYLDEVSGNLVAFKYPIDDVNAAINTFEVRGDQTHFFGEGLPFVVSGSTTNDGTYTVVRSVFDTTSQTTKITVAEKVTTSLIEGFIDIEMFSHNWQDGDIVVMSSTTMLPYPMVEETPYYVVRVDDRNIRLAASELDVATNTTLTLSNKAKGDLIVSQVKSTFQILGGSGHSEELWYHFELNPLDIRTFEPPYVIVGMQNLINFVDGYEAYQIDSGIRYNNKSNFVEYDSDTGMPVSWQNELERFVDWAYSLHRSRMRVADRFDFTVSNVDDNTLKFSAGVPDWAPGTKVSLTTTGTLPSPLFAGTPYYIVQSATDASLFKLSVSPNTVNTANIVDLLSTGSGTMSIAVYSREQSYPVFEMNPTRNNVWVSTPQGILSNVISGPFADTRVSQTVYDQYGRALTADKLTVYREDKLSHIAVRPELPNDLLVNAYDADAYNYLHIGGGHFFVEGYEHIIMFNNYTVGNDLVYDPFLGLYIKRFDVDYYEKTAYTLRPTLGGYYLAGNKFVRNFEGSIEDMRGYYDVYDLTEGTREAQHARHTIGYHPNDGSMSHLDLLNVNAKSQFLFYRGMIQSKGSVNSVKAYINSKKFVDAKIDEFWMYKIGEFGDSRPKIYPQIKLYAKDSVKSDIRLKFLLPTDIDKTALADIERGFETVSFDDGARWVDFPQQREEIASPLFLNAELSNMTKIYTSQSFTNGMHRHGEMQTYEPSYPVAGQGTIDKWIHIQRDDSDNVIAVYTRRWVNGEWVEIDDDQYIRVVGYNVYLNTGSINDGVRVIRRRLSIPGDLLSYQTEVMNEVDYANGYSRINSEVIKFTSKAMEYAGIDRSNGYEFVFNEAIPNAFQAGDKIKVMSQDSNNGFFTVIKSEYNEYGDGTTRVRVKEPVYPTEVGGTMHHYGFADILIIFNISASADKINPVRLLDKQSHVKIEDVSLWHPACGIHPPEALHNIDVISGTDPARYSVDTPTNETSSLNPWLSPEAGTVWLDTTHLGYVPYYDDVINPDIDTRLYLWGHRQEWSSPKVYQWVETLVSPDNWEAVAAKQAGDVTIPQTQKVTGTPRKTVFKRTRQRDNVSVVLAAYGEVQLTSAYNQYENGTPVMFSATENGSLPSTLVEGVQYYVSEYNVDTGAFVIVDANGDIIDLETTTQLYVVQPFTNNWVKKHLLTERVHAAMYSDFVDSTTFYRNPILTLRNSEWEDGDIVNVYVNGKPLAYGIVVNSNTVDLAGTEYRMAVSDIIDVVRPIPEITDQQRSFDPDVDDDGITLEHWTEMVQYSTTYRTYNNTTYMYYYFWVENTTTPHNANDNTSMSTSEVARTIATTPTPYLIVQDPQDDEWVRGYDVPPWDKTGYDNASYMSYNTKQQYLPSIFYRKAILANIVGYITEDNRYVAEFTRDLTLRDKVDTGHAYMSAKNHHEKWFMFRREQVGAVPQFLWNKMTEALMQCKYDDFTVHVPSFEREHYDITNGTETMYGLEDGQIFVKPEYARATIVHYLQDPQHNFKPVDINNFFEMFPATDDNFWKQPQKVKDMCDFIYNTFDTYHTNGIWFEVLSDALVTKSKYKGLMKTSWLALHGIRILDVGGMFDD